MGSKYCSDLKGYCHGPGGDQDYINAKYKQEHITRAECQAKCDAALACVGYSYLQSSTAQCNVYGPGLDRDITPEERQQGWMADSDGTTTIAGASDQIPWFTCTAVAGRN